MARSMSRGRSTPPATSSRSDSSMWRTIRGFWPYLWPEDRADLRMRIIWATLLLVLAKLVTIAVPYTFKWATDALAPSLISGASDWWLISIPGFDGHVRVYARFDGAVNPGPRCAVCRCCHAFGAPLGE